MKISTDRLYSKARIFKDAPYIGPSQQIVKYFDDCLDNLMALHVYLDDFEKTKSDKLKIRECMSNLAQIKNKVLSIYEFENPVEDEEVEGED